MPMPPPEMAKIETILVRHIKRFHEKFVERLQTGHSDTLRAAAWQLDAFIQENKQYKDSEYLTTMLRTIEWVIQKKFGTAWTIEKAKRDLRGRTRGVNQSASKEPKVKKIPMPKGFKQALEDRVKPDSSQS